MASYINVPQRIGGNGGPMINPAPTILTSPKSTVADVGGPARLSVYALGSGPLTYQWLFDGSPIAGGKQAVLTIPRTAARDIGTYAVRLSDSQGVETSGPAVLALRPVIVTAPQDQVVVAGQKVTLGVTVLATGPLRFQWRHEGRRVRGGTNEVLVLDPVQLIDAGDYTVAVMQTSPLGSLGVESAAARLNVLGVGPHY